MLSLPQMNELRLTVNGETRTAAPGTTVAGLLATMGVDPARVAVERNQDVVPRRTWTEAPLADGDRIEVVAFVGGGSEPGACGRRRSAGHRRPNLPFAAAGRHGQVPDPGRRTGGHSPLGRRDRHRRAAARRPDAGQAQRPRHDRPHPPDAPAQHRRLLHRRRGRAHLPPGARAGDGRPREARGHRRRAHAVPRRRGHAGGGADPGEGRVHRAALLHGRPDPGPQAGGRRVRRGHAAGGARSAPGSASGTRTTCGSSSSRRRCR